MHKKGVTEEVAKKRTRKTVKHQRGIVGADMNTIMARRNQTAAARVAARQQAVSKAKEEKKTKEAAKTKTKVRWAAVFMSAFWVFCRLLDLLLVLPKYRSSKWRVAKAVDERLYSSNSL